MQRSDIHIEHLAHLQHLLEGDVLSDKAKLRLRCILHYLQHDNSMAETAALFGVTGHALHRWLDQFDPNDASSLEEKSHRPHALRSSTLPAHVVASIRAYRMDVPKMGKEEIVERLFRDHAVQASPSAVGRVIESHCLYFADSPLHKRKRLKARMMQPFTIDIPSPAASHKKQTWIVRAIVITGLFLCVMIGYSALRGAPTLSRLASVTTSLLHLATSYEP